ncbi:MAG: osmotically inducible protein C [Bacteroidia bacterium]|nr:MAG: osmotically inducible protein C [Bacteroidia bacterium]
MTHSTQTTWTEGMAFQWNIEGHKVNIDAKEEFGGSGKGATPKPFMLSALGGCTGMDIVSMLKKMKQLDSVQEFSVEVSGELTEEHPKYYHSMHVKYIFKVKSGEQLNEEKVKKAIQLSESTYCGVRKVYEKAGIVLTSELIIR